jgi:hypothetical protein
MKQSCCLWKWVRCPQAPPRKKEFFVAAADRERLLLTRTPEGRKPKEAGPCAILQPIMQPAQPRLFMILLGCRPKGRHTEQHDLFFTIAQSLAATKGAIKAFWPDGGTLHIDAWREVNVVDGYRVELQERSEARAAPASLKLFFVNLGGYKPGEFEEFHYKMVVAAADKGAAIQKAKATAFYKHTGFRGATSHIDDKYGIDVDDIDAIEDILSEDLKERYVIRLTPASDEPDDALHLGYLKLSKLL